MLLLHAGRARLSSIAHYPAAFPEVLREICCDSNELRVSILLLSKYLLYTLDKKVQFKWLRNERDLAFFDCFLAG